MQIAVLLSWYIALLHLVISKDCRSFLPGITKVCNGNGNCLLARGKWICVCKPSWSGSRCEKEDPDDCRTLRSVDRCAERGKCVVNRKQEYRCRCSPGFTGKFCESTVWENACRNNPCRNGAICHEKIKVQPPMDHPSRGTAAGYWCQCVKKHGVTTSGDKCQTIDWAAGNCTRKSCRHGKCATFAKLFKKLEKFLVHEDARTFLAKLDYLEFAGGDRMFCRCAAGLRGRTCSKRCAAGRYGDLCAAECSEGCKLACHHITGKCSPCLPGYTGSRCETRISNCISDISCGDGGKCRQKPGYKQCDCGSGHQGTLCAEPCDIGRYSRNCKKKCGNCQKTVHGAPHCDAKTGRCVVVEGYLYICQNNDYIPPYCKIRNSAVMNIMMNFWRQRRASTLYMETTTRTNRKSLPNRIDDMTEQEFQNAPFLDVLNAAAREGFLNKRITKDLSDDIETVLDFPPLGLGKTIQDGDLHIEAKLIPMREESASQTQRRILQITNFGLKVEFNLSFPQSVMTNASDITTRVVERIKQNSNAIRIDELPELVLDTNQIQVKILQKILSNELTDERRGSRMNRFVVYGGVTSGVVLLMIVILLVLYLVIPGREYCNTSQLNQQKSSRWSDAQNQSKKSHCRSE